MQFKNKSRKRESVFKNILTEPGLYQVLFEVLSTIDTRQDIAQRQYKYTIHFSLLRSWRTRVIKADYMQKKPQGRTPDRRLESIFGMVFSVLNLIHARARVCFYL